MRMLRIMKLEAMSGVGATMVAHILLKMENPSSANIANKIEASKRRTGQCTHSDPPAPDSSKSAQPIQRPRVRKRDMQAVKATTASMPQLRSRE